MRVKLGEVCDVRDGTHDSPSYVETGYPLVTSKNIVDGNLDLNVVNYIGKQDYEKINERSKVDCGDIIMPMIGTIGNPFIVGDYTEFAIKNVALIKFPKEKILNKYIFFYLQSDAFKRYVKAKNKGGTQKFLSLGDIRNMEIELLSLDEQKKIIKLLNQIDNLIFLRKQQLSKLDELVKARFVELFDRAENIKLSKLNDVCEEITAGGDRPKDTSEIRTEEYPYPVFANAATNNGLLCFSREYKIDKPCVTIAARGCTVGFTAIRNEKFTHVVRLISLVPNKEITPIYLKNYIDIKMNIEGNGAAQPQLTIPMIKSMEIMVPPIELQNRFATFVEQTDKSKLAVQKSLEQLETLKKALMQQYFG